MKIEIAWCDLGRISYDKAIVIQERIHQSRASNIGPDTLLFQENDPVVTLGRGAHDENLLYSEEELAFMGITISPVSRGGDISYHGPGQLVVSPVIRFTDYVPNAHFYIRCLEQVIIDMLATWNIDGKRIKGFSGVWVTDPFTGEDQKIAALGIAISHGIACHGISINVNPNLSHFSVIIPCGISDRGVTSIEALGVEPPALQVVRDCFITAFDNMFGTLSKEAREY